MRGLSLALGKQFLGLISGPKPFKLGSAIWIGTHGPDVFEDRGGTLVMVGNRGSDNITGDDGVDIMFGGNQDDAADLLYGLGGDDMLYGGPGADGLIGGEGADFLDGGEGRDTAFYGDSATGVTVHLGTGQASGGSAEGDVLTSIEGVAGSQYADILTGDSHDNFLSGNDGADMLDGGNGNDLLEGGDNTATEFDTLTGGTGADIFSFATKLASGGGLAKDVITDWGQGDVLRFSDFDVAGFDFVFTGENGGFSGDSASAWYETYAGAGRGMVTEVHLRQIISDSEVAVWDILILGDVDLNAGDFVFF